MLMNKYLELIRKIVEFGETENKEYINLYESLFELPEGIWSPYQYVEALNNISDFVNKYITIRIIEGKFYNAIDKTEKVIDRTIEETIEDIDNLLNGYREDLEKLRKFKIEEDLKEMLEENVDTLYDDEEFNNEN